MIPLFKVYMAPDAGQRVSRVLDSGFIGQGAEVDAFEEDLTQVFGSRPIVTNSCTSAIHLVLTHLGVGPGDEVITTALTCIATNAPILSLGAKLVWADIDPFSGNICPDDVERKITKKTKAIVAVDWTGRRADYPRLRRYGIPVIQDASHGPIILGTPEASGDYVCFSFGPIKHLTAGDGGAILCPPGEDRILRLRRWYGLDRSSTKDFRCAQDIHYPGLKWNMNDINAAIGRANLPTLRDRVTKHQDVAWTFTQLIWNQHIYVPPFSCGSNYWVFPMLLRRDGDRDVFVQWMKSHGIDCSQVHARNNRHSAYDFPNGRLAGLDFFDAQQANISCGWWLTKRDVVRIVEAVNAFKGA